MAESNDPEDRALLHLINGTDPGVKGLILDLLRSSSGRFQNAPVAIRGLMEDLLVGMRLNGASDSEIESRFGLNRGDAAILERVLLGRRQKADGKRSTWRRWPAGSPAHRSSPAPRDSEG
jgi:hypothetical protein